MKRNRIVTKFLSSIVWIMMLCPGITFAQSTLRCVVHDFEKNEISVGMAGGECVVDFVNFAYGDASYVELLKGTLNSELSKNNIQWVSLKEVWLGQFDAVESRQNGSLTFQVSANTTDADRSFTLISLTDETLVITQTTLTAFSVSSDCLPNSAFPGRKTSIMLSGSEPGVSYMLTKDGYVLDGEALQGTGAPLVFEKALAEGAYSILAVKESRRKNMSGSVRISYYPFLKSGLCRQEQIIPGFFPFYNIINGNTFSPLWVPLAGPPTDAELAEADYAIEMALKGQVPSCRIDGSCVYPLELPFINSMTADQLAQLDDMLEQINDGKSMNYEGAYAYRFNNNYIVLTTGPNVRGGIWSADWFFAVDNGSGGKTFKASFSTYPRQFPLKKYTLSRDAYVGATNFSLKLDSSQLAVRYKLFRNGVFVKEKVGKLFSHLIFDNLSGEGTYYVEAHYCDAVVRMNGTIRIDDGEGVASYVKENVYHRENEPSSTYTYYDGLGREMQTRMEKAGVGGRDIIVPRSYDNAGRENRSYLPYGLVNSGYRVNAVAEQDTFYRNRFGVNPYAYAESVFDNSPEDRVVESSLPGYEMRLGSGHTVKNAIRKNRVSDNVKQYTLTGSSLTLSGIYPANALVVTVKTDGEGHVYSEYSDAAGQMIGKSQEGISTYYVSDEAGRLRYIVPPVQDSLFTTGSKSLEELSRYCYYMEYDSRGRVYKQYVPGAGYTICLYDKRDREVFVQDARMRLDNSWRFTKYDALNRPVIEGICYGTEAYCADLLASQEVFGEERGNVLHGYTNNCPPINIASPACRSITYYDDYAWEGQTAVAFSWADSLGVAPAVKVKGQVTGTKTKVLGAATDQWLLAAVYYDPYYQTIQTVSQLYPSGVEVVSNRHDFGGNVTCVKVKQTVGSVVNGYTKYLDYDVQGRLLSTRQQILGDAVNGMVTVSALEYDELGRVAHEKLHNGLETVTHTYDVRNRRVGQSSPHFSYELGFEKNAGGFSAVSTPRYDGSVSYVGWGNGMTTSKGYRFDYDNSGQLKSASFLQKNGEVWGNTTKYAEKEITYDRNGNLRHLLRTGASGEVLHNIGYAYTHPSNGNAVSGVTVNGVASGEYIYDAIGNVIREGRRGLDITYNDLNLPAMIARGTENISYIYTAGGEKLVQQTGSSLTYYRDVMVYAGDNLLYLQHPRGIVRKTNTGYTYCYFLTDHLGSTRVLLEASGNVLTATGTTDYYPFGLSFSNSDLHLNKYLYSGKEFQDVSLGGDLLGWYDFGSRFYDPMLARWFCQDPALQLMSPYLYCGNNPLFFVDPDGEFVVTAFLIGLAVSVAIDYAVQVSFNYASGYRGGDAWFRKVDFFDVAVSGMIGGLTAGFGSAAQTGSAVGKFGNFLLNNQKLISIGETVLTSTVDITGEGWQNVSFSQVGTRIVSAGVTYAARTGLKKVWGKKGFNNKTADNLVNSTDSNFGDEFSNDIAYANALSPYKETKLTNAGRAATKHPQYFGFESTEKLMKTYKTPEAINNLASVHLKDVLKNGMRTTGFGGRFPSGWVTYTLPGVMQQVGHWMVHLLVLEE